MKRMTKVMSLLLAVAMVLSMAACKPQQNPTTGSTPAGNQPTTPGPNNKVTYTVKVQTAGGMPMQKLEVEFHSEGKLIDIGTTAADGTCSISLAAGKEYTVQLNKVPAGFIKQDSYSFNGNTCLITLGSEVVKGESMSGKRFQAGDIMYDFTYMDQTTYVCSGCGELNAVDPSATAQTCTKCEASLAGSSYRSITLSELLEEKKMVMLNFWSSTCGYCFDELPAINNVYGSFTDDIEILLLNDDRSDDITNVWDWDVRQQLKMPVGISPADLGIGNFGVNGRPLTIIIDRYGMITMVHPGALMSEYIWKQIFEYFTADNYVQKIVNDYEDIVTEQEVTEVFPGNDVINNAINSGNLNVTFRPEDSTTVWPFIETTVNGETCIKASNSQKDNTVAMLYIDVELKAGQALAFDYIISSEKGMDAAVVIVNGNDIYQMSGYNDEPRWESCYPWVALEDGMYEVAIVYIKDGSGNVAEDTVYIDNLRIVEQSEISVDILIPRQAALKQADGTFEYEEIFFNEEDGYYHVGSVNGPLLLANLKGYTQFCEDDFIYNMACKNEIVYEGHNYYEDLTPYASYATNSALINYCTVDQRLAEILKVVAKVKGYEGTEYEWLKICEYYQPYGPNNKQLEDPIKGLAPFSSPNAVEGTWQYNETTQEWTFTGKNGETGENNYYFYNRVIMPKGMFRAFTPSKSGAYRVTSHSVSSQGVEGWIFSEQSFNDRKALYTFEAEERFYDMEAGNVSMVYYMEAGKTYYIDIAFRDVYQEGEVRFDLEFLGETYDLFRQAAPGPFTYADENLSQVVTGGIDVILGDDGIYYHLKGTDENGNPIKGSPLYVDFSLPTVCFPSQALLDTPRFNKDGTPMLDENGKQMYFKGMISMGGFDFTKNEVDELILAYMAANDNDVEKTRQYLRDFVWGKDYDAYAELYLIEEVFAGKYHGEGVDRTADIQKYLDQVINAEGELHDGCVILTKDLADLLQLLMDKYTFENVEHAWTKLCYYYEYLGQ